MDQKKVMEALKTIANEMLPEYILQVVPKSKPEKKSVTKEKKSPTRYDVKKRKGCTGILRKKKFDWKNCNIERDVNRIKDKGGLHTFFIHMLSPEKAQSFHSAICNRAKKLIANNPDGTKRWRTVRNNEEKCIKLFVKKPV